MRIMILADQAEPTLWEFLDRRKLEGVDLILSCGDLPANYLSFLTCFTHAPILYVHGNHDARYAQKPPEGCICIEDRIYVHEGVRILGLGGSMRYKPGEHQYTDREMARRIRKLRLKLWRSKGFDMLIAHAPLRGIGDAEDLCHRGFESLRALVEKYKPAFFIHGHVHKDYDFRFRRERPYGETVIVNAWTSQFLEVDETRLRK